MYPQNNLITHNLACVRQGRTIFTNLNFSVCSGETLIVQGPNGSGKSSLLRLLAGLATPAAGQISWVGQNNVPMIRFGAPLNVHYLNHPNGLKLNLTVQENLKLAAHLNLKQTDTLAETLKLFKLEELQHKLIGHLSAGQKRRVALAKLILLPKSLWVLDEPLTALDHEHILTFINCLQAHNAKQGICIMSTHHELPIVAKTLHINSCNT